MSSVAVAERMAIYHWDKLAERDRRVWAGIMVLALACAFAARAAAAEPIESFAVTTSSSQAGGHPDVTASFALQEPGEKTASSVLLEPPAGQLLVPTSVPLCPGSDFATANCSPQTQVGSVTLRGVREGNDNFLFGTAAVYNLVAASGDLGRIGFVIPTIDIPVEGPLTLRSESDYGLRIKVEGLPSQDPLGSATLRLWGVPADPSHDAERLPEGTTGCPGSESLSCEEPSASAAPAKPFTTYPASCLGSPSWTLEVRTMQDPETPTTLSTGIPRPTGCDQLSFNPSTYVSMETGVTDSATGMDLTVDLPLTLSPTTPMPSPLLSSTTDLHGLVTVDSAKLAAVPVCSPQQAKLGAAGPTTCPEASKLGTTRVNSPLLTGPITGALYYGGTLGAGAYLAFVTASGGGVDFKEALLLEPGDGPGNLTVEMPELPQLPISEIQMHFAGGSSSVLRTARRCGPHAATTFLVPWDAALAPQVASNMVVLTRPGGAPCAEEAAAIHVEVEPPSLPADGSSTGTVTATVADESNVPVVGDEIEFEANDPRVSIGPVVDNEDGTYSAAVTASRTPGAVIIAATDRSVEPRLRGEAELVLSPLSLPSGGDRAPSPARAPVTTIGGHPQHKSRKRRPTFAFTADVPGSTFSCMIDSKPYRRCASPLRLTGLKPGRHTFRVLATGPSGLAGAPVTFGFRVEKPPRAAAR